MMFTVDLNNQVVEEVWALEENEVQTGFHFPPLSPKTLSSPHAHHLTRSVDHLMQGLPIYELRTREVEGVLQVWDGLRKKWLVLTPEEHVRQCLVEYLKEELGVPGGLISQEKGISYDRRRKRYDLVIYNRDGIRLLACECKAPYVKLDKSAAMQLAVYNHKLGAPFLMWTNGKVVVVYARNEEGKLVLMPQVPTFDEMCAPSI